MKILARLVLMVLIFPSISFANSEDPLPKGIYSGVLALLTTEHDLYGNLAQCLDNSFGDSWLAQISGQGSYRAIKHVNGFTYKLRKVGYAQYVGETTGRTHSYGYNGSNPQVCPGIPRLFIEGHFDSIVVTQIIQYSNCFDADGGPFSYTDIRQGTLMKQK